jgi:hypothetical protein
LARSDNEQPISDLRYAELVCGNDAKVCGIARMTQLPAKPPPCAASVVLQKIRNILKDEVQRATQSKPRDNDTRQVTIFSALKPLLRARFGKWLTWKSSAKYVVFRYCGYIDAANVAGGRYPKIARVQLLETRIDFDR